MAKNEHCEKLGEMMNCEMVYKKENIILFNSRLLYKKVTDETEREKGIMSNLYTGDFMIPFNNHEFHSSEQLLFYIQIIKWAKRLGIENKEIRWRIDFLLSTKNGFEVKNHPYSHLFYEQIDTLKKKQFDLQTCLWDGWQNQYFILTQKYIYCEEFRNVLRKYENKYWCEDSNWGDTFSGVIWDETIGKYRGVNCVGRAMKRVYEIQKAMVRGQ